MEASVELMTLEPGRPDPGRPGDFSLKATEGWEGFKQSQEWMWRERPGDAKKGVQPGAGPRPGPKPGKHSPVSHCSSQAGTSHRSICTRHQKACCEKERCEAFPRGVPCPPVHPPRAWWYLGRHVHEQDSGNGCLGLAVALLRSVQRVGLQHSE